MNDNDRKATMSAMLAALAGPLSLAVLGIDPTAPLASALAVELPADEAFAAADARCKQALIEHAMAELATGRPTVH